MKFHLIHNWGKWEVKEMTVTSISTGKQMDLLRQQRICIICGKVQLARLD